MGPDCKQGHQNKSKEKEWLVLRLFPSCTSQLYYHVKNMVVFGEKQQKVSQDTMWTTLCVDGLQGLPIAKMEWLQSRRYARKMSSLHFESRKSSQHRRFQGAYARARNQRAPAMDSFLRNILVIQFSNLLLLLATLFKCLNL